MSNMPEKPTYHLTTFGCQMNEHDSERIRGVLEQGGWSSAGSQEDADLLVFNTCSVRESADSRLLGRLGEARRLKRERPGRLVAIGGCFAQSRGEEIFRELPFIDVAFGPQNIGDLPSLLDGAGEEKGGVCAFEDSEILSGDLPSSRANGHSAWIQVMTGCTNFCSYCVVPMVRGPERSRPAGAIIEQVSRLADNGVVEITLLGQNVNAYGHEQAGAGFPDFAGLLEMLGAVEGIERIRFTTSHPKDLSDRLISAMRDLPSVCEHLHLPAQSGSSRILERMRRSYTREHYLGLVHRLYKSIPALSLTTDLIVGFPGEKEDDFHRTMTLVRECRFDGAFTFRYSPRRGTEAAALPGQIPEVTIRRRMGELVELTQVIASEKNRALNGTVQEVLVEGESRAGRGQLRGRTRGNKIVNFTAAPSPRAGSLVHVAIESSTSTTLRGTLSS